MDLNQKIKTRKIRIAGQVFAIFIGYVLCFTVSPASCETILRLESPKINAEIQQKLEEKQDTEALSSFPEELSENELDDLYAEVEAQAAVNVWDPFESFNRDMYALNDTLNTVILNPVSKSYAYIMPEEIRMVIHNFFYNLAAPKRILNCLFQGNLNGMGVELGRFFINTVMGFGGFGNVASAVEPLKNTYDADTDQTLGKYDISEGPYIVLPILNFFTFRSLFGFGGDTLMYPLTYVPNGGYISVGASAARIINDMSFRLNAYEALKDASIDSYATFRDAYVQYRRKKVQDAKDQAASNISPENKGIF